MSDVDDIELRSNRNVSSPEQLGYGATPGSGATAVEDMKKAQQSQAQAQSQTSSSLPLYPGHTTWTHHHHHHTNEKMSVGSHGLKGMYGIPTS